MQIESFVFGVPCRFLWMFSMFWPDTWRRGRARAEFWGSTTWLLTARIRALGFDSVPAWKLKNMVTLWPERTSRAGQRCVICYACIYIHVSVYKYTYIDIHLYTSTYAHNLCIGMLFILSAFSDDHS